MTRDAAESWLTMPEKGTLLGMRIVMAVCAALGRGPARALVAVIVLYYALLHGDARRASRRWLRRVHGRAGGFRAVYRHLLCFGHVTVDRVFLLRRRTHLLRFTHVGQEHLRALTAARRGALLLGAHLGSFEAMRVLAEEHRFRVHVLAHEANARMVNALLRRLDPELTVRLIEVGKDAVSTALQVQELVERGELVALLGDRTGLNERAAEVPFLGAPAAFPTGPYALAAALRCPVYLTFGLFTQPDHYELVCEPFLEPQDPLPRAGSGAPLPRAARRDEALRDLAARFAARLEHHARRAPENWFNFYDFWARRPLRAAAPRAESPA